MAASISRHEKELWTTADVAEHFGVSLVTVRRWAERDTDGQHPVLRRIKMSRNVVRYRRDDVLKFEAVSSRR